MKKKTTKPSKPKGGKKRIAGSEAILILYYLTSCESEVGEHTCDPCEDTEYGKVRSVALIHESFAFADDDYTDVSEWQRGQQEGKIIVIPKTDGEYPEPSEKEGKGYGDEQSRIVGYDHTLTYGDPNFATNRDFYNSLIGRGGYKIAFRTKTKVHIVETSVTLAPKYKVENDNNSEVAWTVTCKWQGKLPLLIDTPEGIFDDCYVID